MITMEINKMESEIMSKKAWILSQMEKISREM